VPENDPIPPETTTDRNPAGPTTDPTVTGYPGANPPEARRRHAALTGRLRYRIGGAVALVGLAVAGGLVAFQGDAPSPDRVPVARDEAARAAAAERADRAVRAAPSTTAPTPSTGAATPTPTATPSADPTTSPPARKSATAARTTAAKPKRPAWVNPMPGATVTSCYGMRWGVLHAGIDLAMPAETPIRAAGAGTVVEAGWAFAGYGISVVVDHGNGWLTHYAHQSRTVVQVGQKVTAGQVIGYEGATGDATGPHLHFEVHQGLWNQVDPAPWMRARGVDLGC
jgi:murein DD-endopeptidase MepM/ murein hydrolase activator NlpD